MVIVVEHSTKSGRWRIMTTTETRTAIPGYTAGTWTIDPVHSEVGFAVRHMMVSKVRGRFTSFSGEIVTGADPLDSSVTAEIALDSIVTGQEQRDAHIRSADFFDVENHPTMTFGVTPFRLAMELMVSPPWWAWCSSRSFSRFGGRWGLPGTCSTSKRDWGGT